MKHWRLLIPGIVAGLGVGLISTALGHWLSPAQAAGPLMPILSIGGAMLLAGIPSYLIYRSRWWPR
jgi:hypothetical protein